MTFYIDNVPMTSLIGSQLQYQTMSFNVTPGLHLIFLLLLKLTSSDGLRLPQATTISPGPTKRITPFLSELTRPSFRHVQSLICSGFVVLTLALSSTLPPLQFIELYGISFAPNSCSPCPAGTFAPVQATPQCIP